MAIYSRSSIQNVKNWWFRIRKNKSLLNLIKEQDSGSLIDKIYLYAKVLSEPKYHFLIKKREDVGIKHLNDPSAFIEHSNIMDVIYNNIDDYNATRKGRMLIIFDDMIADTMTNKIMTLKSSLNN